jgi:hypothetical protein
LETKLILDWKSPDMIGAFLFLEGYGGPETEVEVQTEKAEKGDAESEVEASSDRENRNKQC